MLGTVGDGFKSNSLTASRAKFHDDPVKIWRRHEGRASRVKVMTAWKWLSLDGIKYRSRQSENSFGGEVTASQVYSWRHQTPFPIYSFLIFTLKREKFWRNPKYELGVNFTGFSRVPSPWYLTCVIKISVLLIQSICLCVGCLYLVLVLIPSC